MATGVIKVNMSEETYEYICTACADDDVIKEALKYCVECQQYFCQDCLNVHKKISVSKGHSLLDNSAVKSQGQPRSLPAFPTNQCSKHAGKILDMFCKDHDAVCCYVCSAEDHRNCEGMISVSDNIDQLYSKTDTSRTGFDINTMLDDMNERQIKMDAFLQRLKKSKETAIKAAIDFRMEMEQLLRKLEDASIKEIENDYKKLETQLLKEKKIYEDSIYQLKNLEQLLMQDTGNIAQQFVCAKISQQYLKTIDTFEISSSSVCHAEVIFQPFEELKTSLEGKQSLGNTSATLSRKNYLHKCTKICDINVKLQDDSNDCSIFGSCVVDATVLLTDFSNHKLKRYNISSSSLFDYLKIPENPRGVCLVQVNEVAVACEDQVQFVSIEKKLSLTRSIKTNHGSSYGIAYNDDKLYISNQGSSLFMYDMAGSVLKTVTTDNNGKALFGCSNHITFNDKKDRLLVGDDHKGLVCFNGQCDYIQTLSDPDIRPDGVCVDSYGNVIVADYYSKTIVQLGRDGQKRGVIGNKTEFGPRSVCIHSGLKRMFVGFNSGELRDYHLC